MKHSKAQPHILALACVLAVATTTGLAACGKFEVDPKTKGVSTNSDPLKAEAEERLRSLVAASPTPQPGTAEDSAAQRSGTPDADASDETRDSALDQARRLFEEELRGGGAPAVAEQPAAPVIAEQPAAPAPAPAGAETPIAAPAPQAAQPVAAPAPAKPAALIAADILDESKGQILLLLTEPAMRINFVLAKQRGEILAMKKILDEKKELSKEQQDKLIAFKRSYLLVPEDSMDALLSRVNTIPFSILAAPLLLESQWGLRGGIAEQALSGRAQRLNTLPTDDAVRFRSGRLAMQGKQAPDEARQIYLAELGYNPESGKNDTLEQLRLTQMEVERVMKSDGISTMLDNRIKEISALLVKEAAAKN